MWGGLAACKAIITLLLLQSLCPRMSILYTDLLFEENTNKKINSHFLLSLIDFDFFLVRKPVHMKIEERRKKE